MRLLARAFLLTLFCSLSAFSQQAANASASADAFQLTKVGYVMLGVADVKSAIDFYHGKLGLPIAQQSDDVAFFNAGSISIVVSSEVGKNPGDSETVFAVEHVQQAFDSLSQRGIHFERAPHSLSPGMWAASFRDPDGHVLSLFGPK